MHDMEKKCLEIDFVKKTTKIKSTIYEAIEQTITPQHIAVVALRAKLIPRTIENEEWMEDDWWKIVLGIGLKIYQQICYSDLQFSFAVKKKYLSQEIFKKYSWKIAKDGSIIGNCNRKKNPIPPLGVETVQKVLWYFKELEKMFIPSFSAS